MRLENLLSPRDLINVERELCSRTLSAFIKRAWPVVEPSAPYVHGWHIDAISDHLMAVTEGEIIRLFIAVPPGCMKSLTVGCFWPAWEWGPGGRPTYRYLATSHSANLAIRDNVRTRRLVQSKWYQKLWGNTVTLSSEQNAKTKFENTKTGFREAMAFTGLTGSRGDRVLMDDVLSVDDAISDAKRNNVKTTFLEALPTRLNNPEKSAIVVIQQRLHEEDIIGVCIAKELGYEALVLPMEFEAKHRCVTSIGFKDPRKKEGELLFPERFPRHVVERDKKVLGPVATASQFQQRPMPKGGGMFKRQWFEVIDAAPANVNWVRGWDLAATEGDKRNAHSGPAYTAGALLGMDEEGTVYIGNMVRGQLSAGKVEELIKQTAELDGLNTVIDLPQDPGQAGKSQVRYLVKMLAGYTVVYGLESGSKELRASPLASQAEIGNVKIVRGVWNSDFFDELAMFPMGKYKDQVDAASRAFARLTRPETNSLFSGPVVLAKGGQ